MPQAMVPDINCSLCCRVSSHVVTLHDLMSQPSEAQAGILIQLVIPVACQLLKVSLD